LQAAVSDTADSPLLFVPVVPDSLGTPSRVQVSPIETPESHREIDFVFDTPSGPFIVSERLAVGSAAMAEYAELADKPVGCSTTPADEDIYGKGAVTVECNNADSHFEKLPSGTAALLVQGDPGAGVFWLAPADGETAAIAKEFSQAAIDIQIQSPSLSAETLFDYAVKVDAA
jgi:hypothetical protein